MQRESAVSGVVAPALAPEVLGKPKVTLIRGTASVVVVVAPKELVTTSVTTGGEGVISGSAEALVNDVF